MKLELIYRKFTVLVLLAAILAQTFSKSFVIADYYTNTAKYAKNCINKERPQLKCKGKCQMMKKLQQEEKKEQENPERKTEHKNDHLLSSKSFFASITFPACFQTSEKKYPITTVGILTDRFFTIFHPPQA